ncbi:hypothetical protein DW094_11320 [Ruminococcaceae bacterium AM07-15]|nr:hypothetical protein DW094_11320 [Ruminococcaceae bacterium AM07-15]
MKVILGILIALLVLIIGALAGVVSTAWLRIFGQPKKGEDGKRPGWVTPYYLVSILLLTALMAALAFRYSAVPFRMSGILSQPQAYFSGLLEWLKLWVWPGPVGILALCGPVPGRPYSLCPNGHNQPKFYCPARQRSMAVPTRDRE